MRSAHTQQQQPAPSPAPGSSAGSSLPAGGLRNTKLDHIIQNFYTKTAQVIAQARLAPKSEKYGAHVSGSKERRDGKEHGARRMNKWFNTATEDLEHLKEDLKFWRTKTLQAIEVEPPPMFIDVYLNTSQLPPHQVLTVADENSRWNRVYLGASQDGSSGTFQRILIETWVLTLQHPLPAYPVDLPNLYKRSIVFFRSLHSFVRLLPAYTLYRRLYRGPSNSISIGVRLRSEPMHSEDEVDLDTSIAEGDARHPTKVHEFADIVTPMGTFNLQVQYRRHCDFRIDDKDQDQSSRFIDMDEHFFSPTVEKYQQDTGDLSRAKQRPVSMYDAFMRHPDVPPPEPSKTISATSTSSKSGGQGTQESSRRQHRPSSTAYRSSFFRDVPTNDLSDFGLRRSSAPFISPFKSPSLSSSPQADLFLSNPKTGSAPIEKLSADADSASQRVEFSSSFDKYKDYGYLSRVESSSASMTRRWSRTSDHSSANLASESEDADLEEFMKLIGSKKDLRLFHARSSESTTMFSPSDGGSSITSSVFGSGSLQRSRRTLSHFQNLRDSHANLSESLAASIIDHGSTEPMPIASTSGGSAGLGPSPGSSTSSTGRYQPLIPSPLHAEQRAVVSKSDDNRPVQIPLHSPIVDRAKQLNELHRRHHSSQQDPVTTRPSPEQPAYSSYPITIHRPSLPSLQIISSTGYEPKPHRRRLPLDDSRDVTHHTNEPSPSRPASDIGSAQPRPSRDADHTSVHDDDDSLVFKMTELDFEDSEQ